MNPRAAARLGPPEAVSLGARSAPGTASASLLPSDGPRRTSAREFKPIGALELSFDAIDWRDLELCGPKLGGYLLDHFSGTVDVERMEFQSVLNADAPQWRDVPTVFRRVRCGSAPEMAMRVVVAPPPYEPPERRGCGFGG